MSDLDEILKSRLEQGTNHRSLKPLIDYGSRFIDLKHKGGVLKVINFASNDYLGLSSEPIKFDLSTQPSSRLLSGNVLEIETIENQVAEFYQKPSATLMQSGYSANMGALSCLAQKGDLILADHSIHASLIDGMRLSNASWKRFKHLCCEDLEEKLKKYQNDYSNIWVVVESLFSMDGDIFPLEKLVELKRRYQFHIYLDEAHSIGVYGKEGRGLAHEHNVENEIDITMFNFSKSFAAQGGVLLGSKLFKNYLINRCRPFIYSTATPLSYFKVIPDRLESLKNANQKRTYLKELCQFTAQLFNLKLDYWSPILPIIIGDSKRTQKLAQTLLDHGFYCPAILAPTVPQNSARLRISLNADHQKSDVQNLFNIIQAELN